MNSSYVMDVCSTCGRPAVWPFCDHRLSSEGWTEPVVVRPVTARGKALATLWLDSHRREASG
jgi:hypothetical protein